MTLRFYIGLHQPSDAQHFDCAFISVNRLRRRKSAFVARRWIMDSGAFTEISTHGAYRHGVEEYAAQVERWSTNGRLEAVVSQDWMCEPWIVERTGLTVGDHLRLTVERYDALLALSPPVYLMPVLQGFDPADYRRHIEMYGSRLAPGSWVGVGSVCKRNASPVDIVNVLSAIKSIRPDLCLHGFGLKKTALLDPSVRALLATADSMAWSFAARREGRNQNDWREAEKFVADIEQIAAAVTTAEYQMTFALEGAAT